MPQYQGFFQNWWDERLLSQNRQVQWNLVNLYYRGPCSVTHPLEAAASFRRGERKSRPTPPPCLSAPKQQIAIGSNTYMIIGMPLLANSNRENI